MKAEHSGKIEDLHQVTLSRSTFQRASQLIYCRCGIYLEEYKRGMIEGRLRKRLRALGFTSFETYLEYLAGGVGAEDEMVHMIDAVTTNKTDFFRERHHFDFLTGNVLPEFTKRRRDQTFRVWSAACSTGEEPYSIAMALQDFVSRTRPFRYQVEASDISTQVLKEASVAVYHPSRISNIPHLMRQRYLLQSKDRENPTVRIAPELRQKVRFFYMNLLDPLEMAGEMNVIFCRNVLIYFDRLTQLKVVNNLIRKLRPGGFLFIGHSESLHRFDLPLRQIRPTIFTTL